MPPPPPGYEALIATLAATLQNQTAGVVSELHAMRTDLRYVFVVLVVALVLMAAVVGVGLSFDHGETHVRTAPRVHQQVAPHRRVRAAPSDR